MDSKHIAEMIDTKKPCNIFNDTDTGNVYLFTRDSELIPLLDEKEDGTKVPVPVKIAIRIAENGVKVARVLIAGEVVYETETVVKATRAKKGEGADNGTGTAANTNGTSGRSRRANAGSTAGNTTTTAATP